MLRNPTKGAKGTECTKRFIKQTTATRSTPLDAVTIVELTRSPYRKMIQNLAWATGYNAFAKPLAAGILYPFGLILTPAAGAVLMSASTVIVAINSRFLKLAS